MQNRKEKSLWFLTGSQHLYGKETLEKVAVNAKQIAVALNEGIGSLVRVIFKPVLTTSEDILSLCMEANNDPVCVGVICWMHTFSPSQMWIGGLKGLQKPFVHLHTQYNRDIPWNEIDMDFMNLNQSAHGDREFGFICSRMSIDRHVVTGHWKDPEVVADIGGWARALWAPDPDLKISATAWILAGGAHHTGFSMSLRPVHMEHFSRMTGIEHLLIDTGTTIGEFRNELRWNELYYKMRG